jgi:hypothetical protein
MPQRTVADAPNLAHGARELMRQHGRKAHEVALRRSVNWELSGASDAAETWRCIARLIRTQERKRDG